MLDPKIISFLTVCKYKNITHAAEHLCLSQPAVSLQIKALEEYYQTKLFIYKNKKLSLTSQAEFLYKVMQKLYNDTLRVKDRIRSIKDKRLIHLGVTRSIGEFFIKEFLTEFKSKHPDYEINIIVAETSVLIKKLDEGELDTLFCEGYFDKTKYEYIVIKKERMSIFCSKSLDTSNISRLEDLFNYNIIVREEGSGTRGIVESYLREQNYSLSSFKSVDTLSSPHLIISLLESNLGISILYDCINKAQRLKSIKIDEFKLEHEFCAIWHKDTLFSADYREFSKAFFKLN